MVHRTKKLLVRPTSVVSDLSYFHIKQVSDYRCMSDCRSRGCEFDPGPGPYFRGDWSWNNFYGHSSIFRWFIQEGLLSVKSESMCTKYWLSLVQACLENSVVRWTGRPVMTVAVDLGRKATNQTKINKQSRPWSGSSYKSCLICVCSDLKSVKRREQGCSFGKANLPWSFFQTSSTCKYSYQYCTCLMNTWHIEVAASNWKKKTHSFIQSSLKQDFYYVYCYYKHIWFKSPGPKDA